MSLCVSAVGESIDWSCVLSSISSSLSDKAGGPVPSGILDTFIDNNRYNYCCTNWYKITSLV